MKSLLPARTTNQITSLEYIRQHKLANIVSCSWENDDEIIAGAAEENAFNNVLERLAAAGISVQFASGDSGDLGLGTPLGAVSIPSNSPYGHRRWWNKRSQRSPEQR